MAWEELVKAGGSRGERRDPGAWYITVNSVGVVIFPPPDHPIEKAKWVRTFFGKGEDEGWMMLSPCADARGRKVHFSTAKNGKRGKPLLRFSTLPGVAKDFRLSVMKTETREPPDSSGAVPGSILIRMPWVEISEKIEAAEAAPIRVPIGSGDDDLLPGVKLRENPTKLVQVTVAAPRLDRTSDNEAIKQFMETKGATICWTPEQAAEYLREQGRQCSIKTGTSSTRSGPIYRSKPQPVLDGVEIPLSVLYETVNEYREEVSLPPIAVPSEDRAA
jgi:hypothetical protein